MLSYGIGMSRINAKEKQAMRKVALLSGLLLIVFSVAGIVTRSPDLGPANVHAASRIKVYSAEKGTYIMSDDVVKTKEEWKKLLTPEQFHVLREKGTERAFSGKYAASHEHGIYRCAGCGVDLYRSEDKFESGTGWPSFTQPIAKENIKTAVDKSFFSTRTEILCRRCGGHLGHVFEDGPKPTGLRYCMNSAALQFVPTK
jgi:peptide-methionine (R)-S-oxide reductase